MQKVKDVMTKEPACCEEDTNLEEVAQMMCDFNCGEIPVVDSQDRPIGVITDRDIVCRVLARGKNPLEMTAKECMTTPPIIVDKDTSLDDCCKILEENQIRRVLVLDEEGKCCGIVAQADIALNAPEEKTAELVKEVSKSAEVN